MYDSKRVKKAVRKNGGARIKKDIKEIKQALAQPEAEQEQPRPVPEKRGPEQRQRPGGVMKLQEAVVWSEILGEPVSRKRHVKAARMRRGNGNGH